MAQEEQSTSVSAPATNGAGPASASTANASLRSDINAALLAGGHVDKIQSHLLSSLSQTSWPAAIRTRCVELLRTGEVTTFPALVARIREEVANAGQIGGVGGNEASLRVPQQVVKDGMGFVKECLTEVADVDH